MTRRLKNHLHSYLDSLPRPTALHRWQTYAAAAGSALAFASNASANIIYQTSGATSHTNTHGSIAVQLDSDHQIDLFASAASGHGLGAVRPGVNVSVFGRGNSVSGGFLSRFYPGNIIRSGSQFHGNAVVVHQVASSTFGNFAANHTGYAGFVMNGLSGSEYGWMRIEFTTGGGGFIDSLTLIDYAYNDVAGQSIEVGQTTDMPEPGSMALAILAAGAAGVTALRRRRLKAEN